MLSIHADLSITIGCKPFIPADVESLYRKIKEMLPVLFKQFADRHLFFVMQFICLFDMFLQKFPVVDDDVVIMRRWDEQVPADSTNFVFNVSFFPARLRIAEPYAETVVGTEPLEKLGFCYLAMYTVANACSIVKDQNRRNTSDESEDVFKPLTNTLSSFSSEQLDICIVAVRKGYNQIFSAYCSRMGILIKISLAEINFSIPGIPDQLL